MHTLRSQLTAAGQHRAGIFRRAQGNGVVGRYITLDIRCPEDQNIVTDLRGDIAVIGIHRHRFCIIDGYGIGQRIPFRVGKHRGQIQGPGLILDHACRCRSLSRKGGGNVVVHRQSDGVGFGGQLTVIGSKGQGMGTCRIRGVAVICRIVQHHRLCIIHLHRIGYIGAVLIQEDLGNIQPIGFAHTHGSGIGAATGQFRRSIGIAGADMQIQCVGSGICGISVHCNRKCYGGFTAIPFRHSRKCRGVNPTGLLVCFHIIFTVKACLGLLYHITHFVVYYTNDIGQFRQDVGISRQVHIPG